MTDNFKEECKNSAYKNRLGRVEVGDKTFSNSDTLVSIEKKESCVSSDVIIGNVTTSTLKFETLEPEEIIDKQIEAFVGVKYGDTTTEYINIGKYTITEETLGNTSKNAQYNCYDLSSNLDKEYVCGITNLANSTIGDFYIDACSQAGLIPTQTTFDNSNILVGGNPFTNGETLRNVIGQIAQAGCYFVEVDGLNIELKWFSSEVDETFTKSDYTTLNKNQKFGPVNCVVIGESAIDGSNYTEQDEESIEENGETQISILDNYFLNTEALRVQAMPKIWQKLNGFEYYAYDLTSYTGKPYLKKGNKVSIEDNEGNYFTSFIFTNTFTYNGTFKTNISCDAISKTEQAIKNTKQTMSSVYRNVQRTVDRVNGEIEDVIYLTTDTTNPNSLATQMSSVKQTVDEINSKISDIADITVSGESQVASVPLTNVNESEPILVKIHPLSQNISYLYPRDNLNPSDDLFMSVRTIRFKNTDTNEYTDYELPDDLLYYDANNYDDFSLGYDTQTCVVNKKCGYDANGNVVLLETPRTIECEYPTITLTDGNYEVSLLGYTSAYMYVTLMAKNIYTTQFYTKVETNTLIDQTAKDIKIEASETYTKKDETDKLSAKINVNSSNISAEVTRAINKENEISGKVELKVGKDDNNQIVSMLNASADEITLSGGSKINLNTAGQLQISAGNFKLDESGNMTASNGTFNGGFIKLYGKSTHPLTIYESKSSNNRIAISSDGFTLNADNKQQIIMQYLKEYGTTLQWSRGTTTIDDNSVNSREINQLSLESKKKNFEKLENGLNIVKSTDIYKYNFKEEEDTDKKHIGLVIGDNFNYSKEITSENNDSVELYSMISVLWKAVQEQQEEIEYLKSKIKESE